MTYFILWHLNFMFLLGHVILSTVSLVIHFVSPFLYAN